MNNFHVNHRRGALCLSRVGEWVTRREICSWCIPQTLSPGGARMFAPPSTWASEYKLRCAEVQGGVFCIFKVQRGTPLPAPERTSAHRGTCHKKWSTLIWVVACCLIVPSNYTWTSVNLANGRSCGTHSLEGNLRYASSNMLKIKMRENFADMRTPSLSDVSWNIDNLGGKIWLM